ncbi:Holliday junction resolvase RuvX [Escherichia coli]
MGVAVGQRITAPLTLPAIKAQDGTPDSNIIERLLERVAARTKSSSVAAEYGRHQQPLTTRARKFANRIHGRFGVEVKPMTSV